MRILIFISAYWLHSPYRRVNLLIIKGCENTTFFVILHIRINYMIRALLTL